MTGALFTFLGISFLPMWRVPGRPLEGANLWDYLHSWTNGEVVHIPEEQARREAYYIYEMGDDE